MPWVPKVTSEGEEAQPNSGTYLPCVPQLDLVVTKKQDATEQETPASLSVPLVKCLQESAVAGIEAYASGKRSAILVDRSISDGQMTMIRLKGCGNLSEGFPVEPMPWPFGSDDVRGC